MSVLEPHAAHPRRQEGVLSLRGRTLSLDRVRLMGVLNITPDSFSDGGECLSPQRALSRARSMLADGADILDLGAESTRPGSGGISGEEELSRLLPVLEALCGEGALISVDTRKAGVAREALARGAHLINDVTGLRDPKMRRAVADFGAVAVILHMQGEPETMQREPRYKDVVGEIKGFFERRIELAEKEGVREVILDPGIGFGKTVEHNLEILRRFGEFRALGRPLMLGASRKSFLGAVTGAKSPRDRLEGTIVSNVFGILGGASILRVHDLREGVRTARVAEAILRGRES